MDYLFCVLSDEPYDKQFFLFSAAEPGAVRGRGSDEAYTLGTEVSVSASQQSAMRDARKNMSHMADAGIHAVKANDGTGLQLLQKPSHQICADEAGRTGDKDRFMVQIYGCFHGVQSLRNRSRVKTFSFTSSSTGS